MNVLVLEQSFTTLKAAYSSRGSEVNKLEAMLLEATSRPVIGEGQMIVDTSEVTRLTSQVDTLKTEVLGLRNSLSLKDGDIARERAASVDRFAQLQREIEVLRREAEEARGGYRWVVEHRVKEFVSKLHHSSEFLDSRTRVCEAARLVGYAEGVREGIRSVSSKTPLSRIRLFDPTAADKYDDVLVAESDRGFAYLDALAACAGQSVEELQKIRPASPPLE